MDFLQAKGGVIADLGANGGAIRRYASTPSAASPPRRPYVSPISNSTGRHRRPLHADVGDVTTMTVAPATSERRARTQEDMRNFVSGMTRATRDRQQPDKQQQYYFGAPPPTTPTTPSKVGSGFISNGAFYNGVVELSRRPDGGSGAGLIAGSLQPARKQVPVKEAASPDDDGDDLPLPPPPPAPTHEAADEIQAVERLFREAMAVADERRQQQQLKNGSRTPPPARTVWKQRAEGILVREVDDARPCLSCQDGCPTGYKQHPWRKTCHSCKCPREQHDVYHEEWVNVRERLGFRLDVDQDPDKPTRGSKERSQAEGYSWVPPGLPSHKISEYFSALPAAKRPLLGSPGEKHRDRQLVLQLPKQDLALAYCRHVEQQHTASYEDFIHARNEIALDIGYVQDHASQDLECPECGQTVAAHEVAVVAPKLGANLRWHPACFTCSQCNELLVDLTYCVHDDALFCERHYAEQLKPRCSSCDELIFSGEYTKAMSKDWHAGHFCCWQCDESLTGQRYVLRDEHPYCIKCYESVFANACEECSKTIGIDSKDLSYKDKHWHEACFLCSKCRVSLVDKQFGSKADHIYCGNCYDAQFASRCDGCGEIFRAGTKKMEYKTRQWHEKCFCCVVCKTAIGTKSFIPREQEIYCATCYEEKFATRCVKCNKIITSGGVTYKNEPWHRECFTCTNCNTSLAGQRFTSRDEKPYCADCFGELFAKRCTACVKPITGIGGTRFISFEDRHWHNDCFICASCKTSLVGRGFITDADDIICPECAKQKLM